MKGTPHLLSRAWRKTASALAGHRSLSPSSPPPPPPTHNHTHVHSIQITCSHPDTLFHLPPLPFCHLEREAQRLSLCWKQIRRVTVRRVKHQQYPAHAGGRGGGRGREGGHGARRRTGSENVCIGGSSSIGSGTLARVLEDMNPPSVSQKAVELQCTKHVPPLLPPTPSPSFAPLPPSHQLIRRSTGWPCTLHMHPPSTPSSLTRDTLRCKVAMNLAQPSPLPPS